MGVTNRILIKCIEEHRKDIRQARTSTSLTQEAYANNIDVGWNEARIIRNVPHCMHPIIVKSLEILKSKEKENLINDRLAWEPSEAWKYAMSKDVN